VQRSEHPLTEAEIEAFEATRRATRPLELRRTADVDAPPPP
jgi:hypothetical protein